MAGCYIGTSGYSYKNWRGIFYPPGVPQDSWLSFYAQHFNAVEINATFYRPFPESVYAHWREITPADFRFVLKAPKAITHEKTLDDVADELRQFMSSICGLGDKLSAVLWQFPPNMRADTMNKPFTTFLRMLPQDIKHVFEFRHRSWFNEETYALLNQFHAGFVMNDTRHFPTRETITGQLIYARFHGSDKLYDSLYNSDQLRVWADKIKPYMDQYDAFLFFNNTYAGQALKNAKEMQTLLMKDQRSGYKLPVTG